MLNPSGKYLMYLRKSRKDREAELLGAGETLSHHKQILTELAKNAGIQISAIYKEIVSGETIASRPEMQRLLSEVDEGLWDGVLVMEVERLARGDTVDQGLVAQSFKYSNTLIITPSKIYDPNNEFDEEYFEFGLFMSRREYKTITRRINNGRIASVKEGKYISPVAPYGYNRIKIQNGKGYTLSPDPDRAPVVKMIYDLYTNGKDGEEYGSRKIAIYLDSLGIRPMVNDHWSPATIRDMLKNEAYTGKAVWQKRKEIKSIRDGVVAKSRPTASEYICAPGLHPAIIDQEVFDKAQRIMKSHTRTTATAGLPLKNPLAGLVYCEKCGALMTRLGENKKNKYATLKCPNIHCDNVSSPIFLIEEKMLEFIREWLDTYSVEVDRGSADQGSAQIDMLHSSIEELTKELGKVKDRLNRTYEFLESGIYTPEVFKERHAVIKKEEEQISGKISRLQERLAREERRQREISLLIPRSYALIDLYQHESSAFEKNQILKQLVEKATYIKTERNTRGKLITYNFTLHVWPKLPE